MKNTYLAITLLIFITGCHRGEVFHTSDKEEVTIDDIPLDEKVPSLVWDFIEDKKAADFLVVKKEEHGAKEQHGSEKKGSEEGSGGSSAKLPVLFTPVDVILKEKNKGVLTSEEIVIHMPRGGGQIDLSKYISDQQGSFFVKFLLPEVKDDGTDEKEMKTWFVSNSRKRKLDDEIFGAGCKNFFDISKKLAKEMKHDGIKVNTTRNRHLTVLGGHFVFSAARSGKMLLAKVTFADSKNENLFCNSQQQEEKQ